MPRPSLKDRRTEEILDAFERCIPQYGLEGTSLERIAEEAGVKRTIIRHYIGNRDAVFAAFTDRVIAKFYASTDELFQYLPENGRVDALLSLLFDFDVASDPNDVLVFESLVSAAPRHPGLRKKLRTWVDDFIERIADEVAAHYPEQDRQACWTVAFALAALYFNLDSLAPLKLGAAYREGSLDAAKRLLRSLEAD